MTTRIPQKQSNHDNAVNAAKSIYIDHHKNVWINPGSEKNKSWNEQYIDVIATEKGDSDRAWLVEIETDDSVSSSEAENQWIRYDKSYTERWYLAVPVASKSAAEKLIQEKNIEHCKVITWEKQSNGLYSFWGLPGI